MPLADGGYPGVSISAERLGQMLESAGMETDGFSEGGAVPLFHDNFCHKCGPWYIAHYLTKERFLSVQNLEFGAVPAANILNYIDP